MQLSPYENFACLGPCHFENLFTSKVLLCGINVEATRAQARDTLMRICGFGDPHCENGTRHAAYGSMPLPHTVYGIWLVFHVCHFCAIASKAKLLIGRAWKSDELRYVLPYPY